MNDDADVFTILGILALGLMLAVIALIGLPNDAVALVLVVVALLLPVVAVVAAILISQRRSAPKTPLGGLPVPGSPTGRSAGQTNGTPRVHDRAEDGTGEVLGRPLS